MRVDVELHVRDRAWSKPLGGALSVLLVLGWSVLTVAACGGSGGAGAAPGGGGTGGGVGGGTGGAGGVGGGTGGTGGVGGGTGGAGGDAGGGGNSDGGGSTPSVYASGSRLVWQTLSTSDGAQSYWLYFDKVLGTSCFAQNASDGQLRCLPQTSLYGSGYYADSGCSQELAVVSGCASPGAYALVYGTDAQGTTQASVYSANGVYSGTVYSGSPQHCTAVSGAISETLYSMGAAVPPTTFAALTKHPPHQGAAIGPTDLAQNGTRIAFETVTSADGASGPWYAYDTSLAAECFFQTASDGQERCLPYPMGYLGQYFSDTSCSTPVYEASPPVSPALHHAAAYDATGCHATGYYTLDAAFTGTPYTSSSSTCVAAPIDAMHAYYGVSAFGVTGFQSGTTMGDAGPFAGFASGTRIQLATITSGDGARTNAGWHDALLGEDCELYAALDGVIRCLPSSMAYVSSYFSDAACSVPLIYPASCGSTPHYAASQSCGSSYYQVGALYTGTTYYKNGTNCTASPAGTPLYSRGAAVPASTFQPGMLSH